MTYSNYLPLKFFRVFSNIWQIAFFECIQKRVFKKPLFPNVFEFENSGRFFGYIISEFECRAILGLRNDSYVQKFSESINTHDSRPWLSSLQSAYEPSLQEIRAQGDYVFMRDSEWLSFPRPGYSKYKTLSKCFMLFPLRLPLQHYPGECWTHCTISLLEWNGLMYSAVGVLYGLRLSNWLTRRYS